MISSLNLEMIVSLAFYMQAEDKGALLVVSKYHCIIPQPSRHLPCKWLQKRGFVLTEVPQWKSCCRKWRIWARGQELLGTKSLCWGGNADGLPSPAEQLMGYVSCPTTSGQKMNQLLIALYCSYCQGLFFFFLSVFPSQITTRLEKQWLALLSLSRAAGGLIAPPRTPAWSLSPWDAASSVGTAKTVTKRPKGSFPFTWDTAHCVVSAGDTQREVTPRPLLYLLVRKWGRDQPRSKYYLR